MGLSVYKDHTKSIFTLLLLRGLGVWLCDGADLVEHLLQFTRLVQIRHNIASANKLASDEQLGEGWPVPIPHAQTTSLRVHLQILTHGRTRQDVRARKIASYVTRKERGYQDA